MFKLSSTCLLQHFDTLMNLCRLRLQLGAIFESRREASLSSIRKFRPTAIVLILLAIFRRTGYAVAVVYESKGRCDQWMVREFKVMLVQFTSGPILKMQFVLLFNQQQHSAAV